MESATALAVWIADASVPGARPERRSALHNAYKLAEVAASEAAIEAGPEGYARFARFFAQLAADGWLTFDYQAWPQDPEPPPPASFAERHLQRADNVRLTPEGWRAVAAVRSRPIVEPRGEDSGEQRHFFISHAREDKEATARPLADELLRRGWRVWFDQFELTAGDSLRRSIERGLSGSRFGIVILSPAFFAKEWPQRELDGLTARETASGEKVILPIWHEVDSETVASHSPTLADKLGLPSEMGAEALADELERVLFVGGEPIGGAAPADSPRESNAVTPGAAVVDAGAPAVTEPVVDARVETSESASVLEALLGQNPVRVRESLRQSHREFTASIDAAIQDRHGEPPTSEILSELEVIIRPRLEAFALDLLPLVDHAPAELGSQMERLGDWAGREPQSGYAAWGEVPRWSCWCLGQVIGTYATRTRSFGAIGALLQAQMTTRYGGVEPLIDGVPGSFGVSLSEQEVDPPEGSHRWIAPEWEYIGQFLKTSGALREAAPEILAKDGDPKRAMGDWNFVHCLGLGLRETRSAAYFSLSTGGGRDLALRLHRDDALRGRLARDAYGIELSELDERAPEAFKHARGLGHFHDMDAVGIYLAGSV